VPGVSSSIWTGLFAPKGVPQPIVDKIYADVAEVLKLPDVKARFAAGGGVTVGMPPKDFAAAIRKEASALKVVVAKAGVKPE
jgi:tripartite-type tricarboxylate transporter receptor subunit TctC